MGVVDLNADDKDLLKKLLSNFNHIAVREINLLNVVQELGYSATLTIDPVFLLDKKQWISLIPDSYKKITDKYIFFYHHTFSEDAVQLVKLLSKQLNCKIIEVNAEALPYAIGKKYKNGTSPLEFLGLIHNAEFVVTTSFHGTVFSVIMEKQFFALGMRNNSERSKTLLTELGISERYLDDINKLPITTIDYKVLTINQNIMVENSKKYIQKSINE
jgi:polysaccharide pyruvyl transferase WcaK-like protein